MTVHLLRLVMDFSGSGKDASSNFFNAHQDGIR